VHCVSQSIPEPEYVNETGTNLTGSCSSYLAGPGFECRSGD
jgi:hypothetical protein